MESTQTNGLSTRSNISLTDFVWPSNAGSPPGKPKKDNVYYGIFYDSYDCMEYSVLQIQPKNSKFSCVVSKEV